MLIISNQLVHQNHSSSSKWYNLLTTVGPYSDAVLELPGVGLCLQYNSRSWHCADIYYGIKCLKPIEKEYALPITYGKMYKGDWESNLQHEANEINIYIYNMFAWIAIEWKYL